MKRGIIQKYAYWSLMLSLLLLLAACGSNGEKKQEVVEAEVEVEAQDPSLKVIATSITYPDFLYVLGVTPVAAENYHTEFPSYFNGTFHDVIKLGSSGANLEGMLAAEPDIIIAPKWRDEPIYDQLEKIAKTVLLPDRDDWRDEVRDMGEALDLKEKAEQVIEDYEQHLAQAQQELKAVVGDETFIYMRVMAKESYVMGPPSQRGTVIHKELGLKTVEAYPQEEGSVAISLELLPEFNPDHIILQVDGGDDNTAAQKLFDEMKTSPIWQGLKAVKADQVYMVGDKEWMNVGYSPVATIRAVDEIVDSVTKKK